MNIFAYEFMQKAFIVAILISIITPLIGNTIVLKRLSSIGDALSHSSLAGVSIGLVFGLNPTFSAVLFSILAGIIIEYIKSAFPKYSEISTAVVLSFGVGLAAIFSGFVKNPSSFNSFLFGSIITISNYELFVVVILSIIVILTVTILYRELFYIAFDEESASLSGIKVKIINYIFTILTAIVVSISARTVGALIISSLLVLPISCSLLISNSYKQNLFFSMFFAFLFTITGLFISFFYDLKPGGTIILIGIFVLLILLIFKRLQINLLKKSKI